MGTSLADKAMSLDEIIIDQGTQARIGITDEIVADYAERMEAGDQFPPVVVFHDGSEHYLADGFHRVLAAQRLDRAKIEAEIREGTRNDAFWYALGANKTNGQRMSRGDVRYAVQLALKTWPEKTQREIAEQVGCARSHVAAIQKELVSSDKLTIPETRTGADGKERPTSYQRKEKIEAEAAVPGQGPRLTKKEADALPPAQGMWQAQRAIQELEEIAPNDKERQQAFDHVVAWIKDHRGEGEN